MTTLQNEKWNGTEYTRAFIDQDAGKSQHTGMHGIRSCNHLKKWQVIAGWFTGRVISYKDSKGDKIWLVRKSVDEFLTRNTSSSKQISALSTRTLKKTLHSYLISKTTPSVSPEIAFQKICSNTLIPCKGMKNRKDFLGNKTHPLQPVVLSKSSFVPDTMVGHLMRDKRDTALGTKYLPSTSISNMEGAMHSFVTPLCPITMTGDYTYANGHSAKPLGNNVGRQVILSAAIQPDFECSGKDEVVMKIVEALDKPIVGMPWNETLRSTDTPPSDEYEEQLQKHMIYHLTSEHQIPAKQDLQILTQSDLEQLVSNNSNCVDLIKHACVVVNGRTIYLEAMFQFYVHQVRNEFSALNSLATQGYVYTIDPPAIFAQQIGIKNVTILNRLQILAMQHLKQENETLFSNLKIVGFNDYMDKTAIDYLKMVFPDKEIVSKSSLFQGTQGLYSVDKPYALVLHNNSDAFGQNIETEGPSSMDGVIGFYSDAACHLHRKRPDLLNNIHTY